MEIEKILEFEGEKELFFCLFETQKPKKLMMLLGKFSSLGITVTSEEETFPYIPVLIKEKFYTLNIPFQQINNHFCTLIQIDSKDEYKRIIMAVKSII